MTPIPPFTDEHEALRESLRSFVEREIRPHAPEWEEAREFPRDLYSRMGKLGFLGIGYPEHYGGQGGDAVHDAVFAEEMARCGSGGVSAGIGAHVVNGSKTFITNGVRADFYVTAVKTTKEGGHQGISFLVLEKGMPGFEVSRKLDKLGWHASDTGELSFSDVRVPAENLLGEENKGFYLIMANFQWERLAMALGAVGGMQATFERTLAYAKEREAFGRPIGRFQAVRHKIAEMGTKIEACRDLTYHALRLFVSGQDALMEVSSAKLLACRAAVEVADDAVQLHGGYGYMREYDVERAL